MSSPVVPSKTSHPLRWRTLAMVLTRVSVCTFLLLWALKVFAGFSQILRGKQIFTTLS